MFKPIMIFSGKKNHNMAREMLVSRPVTQHIHVPLRQWKKMNKMNFKMASQNIHLPHPCQRNIVLPLDLKNGSKASGIWSYAMQQLTWALRLCGYLHTPGLHRKSAIFHLASNLKRALRKRLFTHAAAAFVSRIYPYCRVGDEGAKHCLSNCVTNEEIQGSN
eukprot:XP_019919615.1 PREDICTED: uncharacterized protein LOC109617622 [Crassostrea gigas]